MIDITNIKPTVLKKYALLYTAIFWTLTVLTELIYFSYKTVLITVITSFLITHLLYKKENIFLENSTQLQFIKKCFLYIVGLSWLPLLVLTIVYLNIKNTTFLSAIVMITVSIIFSIAIGFIMTLVSINSYNFIVQQKLVQKIKTKYRKDLFIMLFPLWLPLLWVTLALLDNIIPDRVTNNFIIALSLLLLICSIYAINFFFTVFYANLRKKYSKLKAIVNTLFVLFFYSVFAFFTILMGGLVGIAIVS